MSSTSITVTQTFSELDRLAEQHGPGDRLRIRIAQADGSRIEGSLVSIEPTQLTLMDDATHDVIRVPASEMRALEVHRPRRGREWALAGLAIVGATAALIGYAMFPWVRPDRPGDILMGFMILALPVVALFPVLLARTRLGRWFTQWRQLYPPG